MPNDLSDMTNEDVVNALRLWARSQKHNHGLASFAADRLETLMEERDDLAVKLASVQRAARNIHDINAKLINDSGKVHTREQNVDAQIGGVQAANAILTEEIERLTEELAKTSEALIRQRMEHNARVTELLEANNREVERRRKAEGMSWRDRVENASVNKLWDHIPHAPSIQRGGMISE